MTQVGRKVILEPVDAALDLNAWWQTLDTPGAADYLVASVPDDDLAAPDAAIDFG